MSTQPTTVSLVLGSGGARGLAHIGVIQWLTENGYAIRSISGTSMGALVGGIKMDLSTAVPNGPVDSDSFMTEPVS